tara:strand:- start:77 stop:514 length:438 start_codon:yes stop_codon:yes gene_type:complete
VYRQGQIAAYQTLGLTKEAGLTSDVLDHGISLLRNPLKRHFTRTGRESARSARALSKAPPHAETLEQVAAGSIKRESGRYPFGWGLAHDGMTVQRALPEAKSLWETHPEVMKRIYKLHGQPVPTAAAPLQLTEPRKISDILRLAA